MNKDLSNLNDAVKRSPATSDQSKQKASKPSRAMEEATVQIDIDIKLAETAAQPIAPDLLENMEKTVEAVAEDEEAAAVDNETVNDELQGATDGSQVAMFDQDKMINIDDSQA